LDRQRKCLYGSSVSTRLPVYLAPEGVDAVCPKDKVEKMSRACELTGKAVMSGNNVSHANNKSRRRFLPNLCDVTLMSEALGQSFRRRVSAAALRSVEHRGGLDKFLLKASSNDLSQRARLLKKQIAKKVAEETATEAAA